MKKYMEDNLLASKVALALPKRVDPAFEKSKVVKTSQREKEKPNEEVHEKYSNPLLLKKGNAGPSDQHRLHKKLRAILSRKNITKAPAQQISQVQ